MEGVAAQTNEWMDILVTKVEEILKSETQVLLASQRSVERRQAKLEMLLKQWIDSGSHAHGSHGHRSNTGSLVSTATAETLLHTVKSNEIAYYGTSSDSQVTNPGQDKRQMSGSLQCKPHFGSQLEPNVPCITESAQESVKSPSCNCIAISKSFFLRHMRSVAGMATNRSRKSELGQRFRQKVRHDAHPGVLEHIVFSWAFDVVCGMLIVLNSLSIGAEIEYRTTHSRPSTLFTVMAATFAGLFFVELVLRIAANELIVYFRGPEKLWNIFDVVMVIASLVEVVDTLVSAEGRSSPSLRLVRMIRLLRIARVLRFIPQLRIILIMVFESIKALGWLLCILATILYVFSIIFTTGAIDYLEEWKPSNEIPWSNRSLGQQNFHHKRYSAEIATHYGTLMRSHYSLFKAITSGQSWGEMMDPLTDVHAFYVGVFVFYVAFAVLALLNVVAGVFVERALTKSQYDRDMLVEKQIQSKQASVEHLKVLFEESDLDGSGSITLPEFETHMKNERFAAYLSHLAVDASNIEKLFHQLDRDKSGCISVQEFVDNLLYLTRGQTVEQVVQRLMNESRHLEHLMLNEFRNIKLWIGQSSRVSAVVDDGTAC